MKKRNFVLIGISIILQITGITIPFIGIGSDGISITNLSAALLVGLILLMIGLKGLYKDTNNNKFYNGFIITVVGICVLLVGTLISPMIAGCQFLDPLKYLESILENINNNHVVILSALNFLKSFKAFFIVIAVTLILYTAALFKFVSGIKSLNIVQEHKNKTIKSVRRFAVSNLILSILSVLIITFFIEILEIAATGMEINVLPDELAAKIGILAFLIYTIVLPLTIVTSIFYYVNIIKSIILIFKIPNNFIIIEEETIELNRDL